MYLNLDPDYFDHPKTLFLIRLVGPGGAELPLRLWSYCGKFKPKDGQTDLCEAAALEAVLRWWGTPGAAAAALMKAGFVGKNSRGYFVHDWNDHQGHIWALKKRNQKVARKRWQNIRKSQISVDTSGIPKSTTSMPLSNPIQSNPIQTRTDKVVRAVPLASSLGNTPANPPLPDDPKKALTTLISQVSKKLPKIGDGGGKK